MLEYKNQPTAAVVLIGNELLQGEIQDTNLRHIAVTLQQRGIRIIEARVIADDEAVIMQTINHLRVQVDYLFTTGGIGPTHDDITTLSIAKAFGVPVIRNQAIAEQMRTHKANVTEATLRMADVPRGATLLENPISIAPGFCLENVFVMAGVPDIMQAMLENALVHLPTGMRLFSQVFYAFAPESKLAATLAETEANVADITIGSYPTKHHNRFCVRIVLRGYDKVLIQQTTKQLTATLAQQAIAIQPAVD